jgi:hypothetical protein
LELALSSPSERKNSKPAEPGKSSSPAPGRVEEEQSGLAAVPLNLRVLPVAIGHENVGLRKIGLRRSPAAPDTWEIYVAVRNYGARSQEVDPGAPVRRITRGLAAFFTEGRRRGTGDLQLQNARTGYARARLNTRDAFPQDDRASIDLPAQKALHVIVYSADPEALRALIGSNAT